MNAKQHKAGFTLIELMLVVTIIAILLGIAVPNMLRSKAQANETSAIGDLRVIAAGQISYQSEKYTYGDWDALTSETDGDGTGFLTKGWVEGRQKAGYIFNMPLVNNMTFVCFAAPVAAGNTGVNYFRVDPTGIIRYSKEGPPAATDPPVGG